MNEFGVHSAGFEESILQIIVFIVYIWVAVVSWGYLFNVCIRGVGRENVSVCLWGIMSVDAQT